MSVNLITLSTYLIIIANIVLGFLVFLRNPRNRTNISFGLMTLCLVMWLAFNYYVDRASSAEIAFLYTKLTNIFATWASYFYLIFTAGFSQIDTRFIKIRSLINYFIILPIVFTFLILFGQVISGVLLKEGVFEPLSGPFVNIHLGYFLITFGIGIWALIFSYLRSRGGKKQQFRYMILGLFIFIVSALSLSSLIPLLTNRYESISLAPASSIFFLAFTTYAIVRHRLMDIRMVVARSLGYALLLLTIAGVYAGSVLGLEMLLFPQQASQYTFAQTALRTVIAVVMVFLFQPLRRFIMRSTDRIFFKNAYDTDQFLEEFSHEITSSIVLIEIVHKAISKIMETVRINRGLMVVLAGNHIYTSHSIGYRETPKIEMDNIGRLIKDGIVVFDELEENSRLKTVMRKFEALIAIPLKTDKDKQGLLLLGEKLSGDMYSQKDIAAFEVIGPEIAVALTNAQAYERIEKFNTTLRTEINKATADLQRKNEQLRELDKAKDEFISMASHQLRTPLTAIKGYLSMLLEGDAGEIKVSQYDFVNEAFQGANRMVGLINDLLNVSRMETGRFFLEPVEVDLDKVVQEEVKQLYNHAKEKHLYIRYEKKGEVPKVMADETKIRQVIMNFIDNAVYYTNTGGVTVHLRKDKQDVVFEVHDTGIGVPKSAQKSLFSKFYRADNARHVRPDGTGLGIYLAKRVMDDHNGEIIFKSTEGKGSVFGFRLAIKSKFSDKSVTPPAISAPATAPSLGELAAGVGVSAEAVRECQVTPPPACDPPKVVSPTEGADKATQLLKEAEEHRN